jgi:DNA-binding NarL/FixJ family response regulator
MVMSGKNHEKTGPRGSILLVLDRLLYRESLRALLDSQPGFRVVATAAAGRDAARLARQLRPPLVLVGAMNHDPHWRTTLRELGQHCAASHSLLLADSAPPELLLEALELGARGVLAADTPPVLLFRALHAVEAGEFWVGREAVGDLVATLRGLKTAAGAGRAGQALSTREAEIARAVAAGASNKEIARRMAISINTVKHHLTRIFAKRRVTTRLELAIRTGRSTPRSGR